VVVLINPSPLLKLAQPLAYPQRAFINRNVASWRKADIRRDGEVRKSATYDIRRDIKIVRGNSVSLIRSGNKVIGL
jgi:hypothetical protein